MTLHMLCGLPRAGSTLLANLLEQHPDVWVSGTSSLSPCVQNISRTLSVAEEVKSELAAQSGQYERYVNATRSFAEGWYADIEEPVVIDKGRLWTLMRPLVDTVFPESKFIICVRDPRDVVLSVEKQHRNSAMFMQGAASLWDETARIMAKDGLIGGPIWAIEDLIRRGLTDNVAIVRYETLVMDPATTIATVAQRLGLEKYDWDYENVVNRERDEDAIWRGKFPHKGDGPIKAATTTWRDGMDPALAATIANSYPLYMKTFGYLEN